MADELAPATGDAEPIGDNLIREFVAKSGVPHQPARVTLTIELGTLTPEVLKALQLFVTAAVSGGPAVAASVAPGRKPKATR